MIREYSDEVDFEVRMDSQETRDEVTNNLKNVIQRIDAGEEMMIEFYIKTQEKLG